MPLSSSSSRTGASALEFALLLPILTIILGSIIEFGWIFLQSNALLMATRAAARAGASVGETASPSPGDVADSVASSVLSSQGVNVSLVNVDACITTISAGGLNQRALHLLTQQAMAPQLRLNPHQTQQ